MAHRALTVVAVLVLILGAGSPVYAASRAAGMGGGGGMRGGGMGGGGQWRGAGGQWHGGGKWHGAGNWHGNFHGQGCCGTRVFVGIGGGFGWGPWWWGGWGYPYPYPYPYYAAYAAPATTYMEQVPSYGAPSGTQQTIIGVQREVIFPNGKYVLYGDGVNQPWQWVWVPSAPPPPPPPPQ